MMIQTRLKKSVAYLAILSGIMYASAATAGRIDGSAHDFEDKGWSGGDLCTVCHAPHALDEYIVDDAPLWNHTVTVGPFVMYTSPTLDATQSGSPDGISLLCLSCHDGTVALDSYGDLPTSTAYISSTKQVGPDLSNDHPISIVYDPALAVTDPGLFDPDAKTDVTIGVAPDDKTGSITDVMLYSNKVQCASCHDVHNRYTIDEKLLKITMVGSALCLTCHDK